MESISNVPTLGGTITIQGQNFGNDPSLLTIRVNSHECQDIAIISDSTLVTCTVSSGTGRNHTVVVTAAGQDSPSVDLFSYLGNVF